MYSEHYKYERRTLKHEEEEKKNGKKTNIYGFHTYIVYKNIDTLSLYVYVMYLLAAVHDMSLKGVSFTYIHGYHLENIMI